MNRTLVNRTLVNRTLALLSLGACAITAPILTGAQETSHSYVGVKACSLCHKGEKKGDQFGIWEKSKHAQAYEVLTTPAADDIAKAKGLTTPAAESPACLECHAIVGDAKADVKNGVQCEVCHGPGSDYKTMAVMKDKGQAIAAGLREYTDKAAIEALCRKCHNERSPTAKAFVFEERWAKIQHPRPAAP